MYCCSGSSPLSRGIPYAIEVLLDDCGIIPALAGNTDPRPHQGRAEPDHPRSRGEYLLSCSLTCSIWGSSPLSRGIHTGHVDPKYQGGIIPALAGNTPARAEGAIRRRDHPRSRGEYPWITSPVTPTTGSSPLSRGIPAGSSPPSQWVGDHPRSRGEYCVG